MPDRRARSGAVGVILIAAAAGCAEELGPEVFETTRVEGTARIAGQPIPSGWVEFLPVEGTRGDLRSAPIRKDGSFAADGVPVGRVAIGIAALHGPPIPTSLGPVERSAFRGFRTPIRRAIPSGDPARLDLDLAVEAESFRMRQRAVPSPTGGPSE